VQPKRSKPCLASAIATLLSDLERFRKELAVRAEAQSETRAKMAALQLIADEKFESQMAEYYATLNAGRRSDSLPMPMRYDIPEQNEIRLLWESPPFTSGLPVIDQRARTTLVWLSPNPQAKIVLEELDKLMSDPSLANVNGMIAFLAEFPGPGRQVSKLDERTPSGRIRRTVATIYRDGLDEGIMLKHSDLCERLDALGTDRPPSARWNGLKSWVDAWNNPKFRRSVSRWLSEAIGPERRKTQN
jgi:hypothetical protein